MKVKKVFLWGVFAVFIILNGTDFLSGIELGSEFYLDQKDVITSSINDQMEASVAFDGTNYMAVWSDKRNGKYYDIYGAIIAPDGTVIGQKSFLISSLRANQRAPKIIFNGSNYFVVWFVEHGVNADKEIFSAILSTEGKVLSKQYICKENVRRDGIAIAFDGTNNLVVWGQSGYIKGKRVHSGGTVLDKESIEIARGVNPDVAFGGTDFLVVFHGRHGGISANRVSKAGKLISTGDDYKENLIIYKSDEVDTEEYNPRVFYNGENYFVTWFQTKKFEPTKILGVSVNNKGEPLGEVIILASENVRCIPFKSYIGLDTDGDMFYIAWISEEPTETNQPRKYSISVMKFYKNGEPASTDIVKIHTDNNFSSPHPFPVYTQALSVSEEKVLVLWEDTVENSSKIKGTIISKNENTKETSFLISLSSNNQDSPAMAFDGENYFVLWSDNRESPYKSIYCAMLSTKGTLLAEESFIVSENEKIDNNPAIAFDGKNYFAVWDSYDTLNKEYSIKGVFISKEGKIINSKPIELSKSTDKMEKPSIAYGNGKYYVLWHIYDGSERKEYLNGIRVDTEGIIQERENRISGGTFYEWSVTYGNGSFFIVSNTKTFNSEIIGVIVNSSSGEYISNNILNLADSPSFIYGYSMAYDGDSFFLVWSTLISKNKDAHQNIYGTPVSKEGVPLNDGTRILQSIDRDMNPYLIFNGIEFIMAWEKEKTNGNIDIYAATFDEDFTVTRQKTKVISEKKIKNISPVIVSSGDKSGLIVYTHLDEIGEHSAYRIMGNLYSYVLEEEIEESDDDDLSLDNDSYEDFPDDEEIFPDIETLDDDQKIKDDHQNDKEENDQKDSSGCSCSII